MDDLEEQLARLWIENEDGTVDWLCCQVALECLVDGDSVDVGVIDEPDYLIREELCVILRVEIWFGGLA